MKKISAFIFDMNGTMIDDMPYHIKAWHDIVTRLGAHLTMQQVKEQCYGKNEELLERIFPGRFTMEEKKQLEHEKESYYQRVYKDDMKAIDGLHEFLARAWTKDIHIAMGSAAIMFNIDFILDGLNLRPYFKTIVSADHVEVSKPDPETFLKAAKGLGIAPEQCVVFEDAPKGVETALNAGMQCVVLTTMHTKEEFGDYPNIICFIKDYTDPVLNHLFEG
jgi:beta-phosphoglucomutase family hydrolase